MTAVETTIPQPPVSQPSSLMKRVRFALAFLAAFILVFGGVITLHVLGNPDESPGGTAGGGMFPSPIVPNHSNRSWKARRILAMVKDGQPPQIVILGSSRMMQLSPMVITSITGKRAFNFAAVGASPMEYLAQLKFLIRRGAKPETIIVGIDDRAMFGLYHQWEGRMVEDWNVLRETPLKQQLPLEWQAVTQIRLEKTPDAIRQLIYGPKLDERDPLKAENFLIADGYRIRSAGTILARKRRPPAPDFLRARLKKYVEARVKETQAGFAKARVQQRQKDYVAQILKLAKSKGIKVKIVMTPMQPYYAQAMLTGQAKRELDKYATELRLACKRQHVDFYDCRDIASFKGLDYEFWDEQHPTPANTLRMANAIFGLKPTTPHPDVPDDGELATHFQGQTTLNTW